VKNGLNEHAIRKFNTQQISAFLFAELLNPSGNNVSDKEMAEAFRLVGVDVAAIRKTVTAEAAAGKVTKGVCRICKCTHKTPCKVQTIPGSKATQPCAWTDKTKTLCTNPKCVAAAKSQTSANKKAE
jgi:hypothetical protein